MHIPFYTSPNTCAESTCAGDENLRDTYHPLFDKYEVDLVLEGHVHNYQRSYPIAYNPKNLSSPTIASLSKSSYNNPQGEIYAVVGTGGINLHGLSGKRPYMASQQDSKFGILALQISDSKVDGNFISNEGSVLDQFSITKTLKKTVIESISSAATNPSIDKSQTKQQTGDNTAHGHQINNNPFVSSYSNPSHTIDKDNSEKSNTDANVNTYEDTQELKPSKNPRIETNSAASFNSNPFASVPFP